MATITANTGSNNWNTNGAWVGAVQPGASDDVIIPASAVVTIPTATTVLGRSCTVQASGTLAFASTTAVLTLGDATAGAGSVALSISSSATITLTGVGTINLVSTSATVQTVTTGGKTLPNVTVNGVGSSYQLADSNTVSVTGTMTLTAGTLDTNGQTCTWGFFASTNSNVRTLTLGASSITINGNSGTHWSTGTITNMTFNANTSTITLSPTSTTTFAGGGLTFNNFVWNHPSLGISGTMSGTNTFNNFTFTPATSTNTSQCVPLLNNNFTVTGTFTVNGTTTQRRPCFLANNSSAQITITAAAVSLSNVDFVGITAAGAAIPFTGTSMGDGGNNSNITFDSPVTRYWVGGTGSWNDTTHWSTSTGGSTGASIPLPQDTVHFDGNSGAGNSTRNMLNSGGAIDCTGYTGTLTINQSTSNLFGNLTMSSSMTLTASAAQINLRGGGSQTITSAGRTWAGATGLVIITANGSYALNDDITLSATLNIANGTFDASGHNVTAAAVSSSNSNTRTIHMGSGSWTVNGTSTIWQFSTMTGITFDAGTSTLIISDASASTKTFAHGSSIAMNNVTITGGGTGAIIFGANALTVNKFVVTTSPTTITFTSGGGSLTTINGSFNLVGSPGNLITINASTGASAAILSSPSGDNICDYLSLTDSTVQGGANWYAGLNSTINTNVNGWLFGALNAKVVVQPGIQEIPGPKIWR